MSIPQHLRRHPTRAAIDSLARRLDLPNRPGMQDWEWEVADPSRLDEFIQAYESGELDADERFTLMETIIQSFEELQPEPELDSRWHHVVDILDRNMELHAYSVWRWAALDVQERELQYRVSPSMRRLLLMHRIRFYDQQG